MTVRLDRDKTIAILRSQIAKAKEAEQHNTYLRPFDGAEARGRRLALADVIEFIEHGFLDAADRDAGQPAPLPTPVPIPSNGTPSSGPHS